MGWSAVVVPYTTYLRVYEPLDAFPEPERGHWKRYAAEERQHTAQEESRQALAGLVPVPPVAVPAHESPDAFVTLADGVTLVCPWRTRLRGWLALEELVGDLSGSLLDAVLPPVVRHQAVADYEQWRARNPDARPWIRSAIWHVPVRWFVLFDEAERHFEPAAVPAVDSGSRPDGGRSERTVPALRYRTAMVQARRRVARALRVLRDSQEEGPLVDGLVDVGRWLEEFHPRSLVELDYGGLVHVIPEHRLRADHSAADVGEGLAALREGDSARARAAYARVTERWREVRELQYAS